MGALIIGLSVASVSMLVALLNGCSFGMALLIYSGTGSAVVLAVSFVRFALPSIGKILSLQRD